MERPATHHLIKRLIPPLAIWALGKVLDTPKVKGALQDIDSQTHAQKRKAMRSVRRAGRNAASNSAWLAAGAAAIVVGIGLMARAARGK
jgi:hypothetical protein